MKQKIFISLGLDYINEYTSDFTESIIGDNFNDKKENYNNQIVNKMNVIERCAYKIEKLNNHYNL